VTPVIRWSAIQSTIDGATATAVWSLVALGQRWRAFLRQQRTPLALSAFTWRRWN